MSLIWTTNKDFLHNPSLFLLKWVDSLKVFKQTFFFFKKNTYFCAVNLPKKALLTDISGSVWLRSAVMNLDNSLLQYLLSGMEKNALLLVEVYTPLYIDQEREQFFLSISRGSREPITVDRS